MRVALMPEALEDAAAWEHLDQIASLVLEGRHRWDVEDSDEILASAWLSSEPESRATRRNIEALERSVTAREYDVSPILGETRSRCHSRQLRIGSVGDLRPDEAISVLREPAYLVLENANDSDDCFVRALIHAYVREELSIAVRERWLVLDHAGGSGEVKKRVRSLLDRHPGHMRVRVLSDSDRLTEDHTANTIMAMQEISDELAITVHVLHKREAENYLPLAALTDHCEGERQRSLYPAFSRLTPEQQDYFDMKNGFTVDRATGEIRIPTEQETLYENLRPAQLHALSRGFGSDAIQWFGRATEPMPYYITRENLEARCARNPGELLRLLVEIEEIV